MKSNKAHSITTLAVVLAFVTGVGAAKPDRITLEPTEAIFFRGVGLSSDSIAFSYAGDLWTVPRSGGTAQRLTEGGADDDSPSFSPDGKWIAFSRTHGGNIDVFVIPAQGGEEVRLTFHPKVDAALGWTPDGESVLLNSGRDGDGRRSLYTVSRQGGLPTRLEVPSGYQASFSPDGKRIAYLPRAAPFIGVDDWRYYRGGLSSPLWLLELDTLDVSKVTTDDSNSRYPMWIGNQIYFLSDQTGTFNLYVYDAVSGKQRQLTSHNEFGIRKAAANSDAILFVRRGQLFLFDLASQQVKPVEVRLEVEAPQLQVREVEAAAFLESLAVSEQTLVAGARGDVFVISSDGQATNLTRTPGVAERYPALAPDGRRVAYFSDSGGEYSLHIKTLETGRVEEIQIESQPSFYRELSWSPDGQRLVFSDNRLSLWIADLVSLTTRKLDQSHYIAQRRYRPNWSPGGRYLAYAKALENRIRTLFVHDFHKGETHQITEGTVHVESPVFDRSGLYLYFIASPTARLAAASDIGWGLLSTQMVEPLVTKGLHLWVLRDGDPAPFFPVARATNPEAAPLDSPGDVEIDFGDPSSRFLQFPIRRRDYLEIAPGKPGTLFVRTNHWPHTPGSAASIPEPLFRVQLSSPGELEEISEDSGQLVAAESAHRVMAQIDEKWFFLTDESKTEALPQMALSMTLEPSAEWRQMYDEAWRMMRDYFYDPNHHGQDLEKLRREFARYLPSIIRRRDLNLLFQEMLGQVSVSHLRVGGGDIPSDGTSDRVGVVAADFELNKGAYQITHIAESGPFTTSNFLLFSPLELPGVDVQVGDYLLAVDGQSIDPSRNIFAYFQDKVYRPVKLTVADSPDGENWREVSVVPTEGAGALRNVDWAEKNARLVEKLSGGRIGYVYVPGYGFSSGIENLYQALLSQKDKEGLIIDQRYNGGGTTSDRLIEALTRPYYYSYAYRYGRDFPVPPVRLDIPKVLVIHHRNFSAAETFAHMFKLAGVGPIVGTRTGGGGIGSALFQQRLIDGGRIGIPNRAAYNPAGSWDIENYGVTPDYEVDILPKDWAAGRDPQLEKAVEVALELADQHETREPQKPKYPVHP